MYKRAINVEAEFQSILRRFARSRSNQEMTRATTILLEKLRHEEDSSAFAREQIQKNLEFSIITGGDVVSSFESYRDSIEIKPENSVRMSDLLNEFPHGNREVYITYKQYEKSTLKRERKVNWNHK